MPNHHVSPCAKRLTRPAIFAGLLLGLWGGPPTGSRAQAFEAPPPPCLGPCAAGLQAPVQVPTPPPPPPPPMPILVAAGQAIPANGGLLVASPGYPVTDVVVTDEVTGEVIAGTTEALGDIYYGWSPADGMLPVGHSYVATFTVDNAFYAGGTAFNTTDAWYPDPDATALAVMGSGDVIVNRSADQMCCNGELGPLFCFDRTRYTRVDGRLAFETVEPPHHLNQFTYRIGDNPIVGRFPETGGVNISSADPDPHCAVLRATHIVTKQEWILAEVCLGLEPLFDDKTGTWSTIGAEELDITPMLSNPQCVMSPFGMQVEFCQAKRDVCMGTRSAAAGCQTYGQTCLGEGPPPDDSPNDDLPLAGNGGFEGQPIDEGGIPFTANKPVHQTADGCRCSATTSGGQQFAAGSPILLALALIGRRRRSGN